VGIARRCDQADRARAPRSREDEGRGFVVLRFASRHAGAIARSSAAAPGSRSTNERSTPGRRDRCGPKLPDNAILLVNLIVVVEVLSPSTAAIDHGRKLSGYFSLPSVEHYLILDPDRRVVIHHKRGSGDAIETRVLSEGVAKLDPPGFDVAIEALFPALTAVADVVVRT